MLMNLYVIYMNGPFIIKHSKVDQHLQCSRQTQNIMNSITLDSLDTMQGNINKFLTPIHGPGVCACLFSPPKPKSSNQDPGLSGQAPYYTSPP